MDKHLSIAALTLAIALNAQAGVFEYSADDGSGNVNIGPSFTAQMLWGNYFNANPSNNTITTINISFGSIAAGRPVDLLLFDDPDDDGNPANAVVVAQTVGLTVAAGPNVFTEYAIAPTSVSGGFFVAAMMQVTSADRPGRLDPQSITGQSWLYFADQVDLGNLGSSPFVLNMDNAPIPGTWLVRAQAIPTPASWPLWLTALMIGPRRTRCRQS